MNRRGILPEFLAFAALVVVILACATVILVDTFARNDELRYLIEPVVIGAGALWGVFVLLALVLGSGFKFEIEFEDPESKPPPAPAGSRHMARPTPVPDPTPSRPDPMDREGYSS